MKYTAYWGEKNDILFVGDSRIRSIYEAFVQHINPSYSLDKENYHSDMNYANEDLNLNVVRLFNLICILFFNVICIGNHRFTFHFQRFIWRPVVNIAMYDVYRDWRKHPPDKPQQKQPAVVITGSGTWTIKELNGTEEGLMSYTQNITRLVPILNKFAEKSKVLWMLQDPVVHEKLSKSRQVITNEHIDLYNKAAMDAL